jgi:hypothetical protein
MTDQEPLKAGDRVIVSGDRRAFLNSRRGTIKSIIGNIADVEFDELIGRTNRARVLLEHLKKV